MTNITQSDVADAFIILKDYKTFKEEIVVNVAIDTIKHLCVKCGFNLIDIDKIYKEKTERFSKAQPAKNSPATATASNLLKQWMVLKPNYFKPEAWEYSKTGAKLVADTAIFLGIPDPWAECKE